MKYRIYIKVLAGLALLLTIAACNKNSTSWLNRKYQNMVARYNVYYNGTERLKEVKLNLALNHKDDYSQVLDVFPYGDEAQAKAQQATLDEIIKKGSKIILDRPVSKWVDDAYLLVGKAYFFKADYYAAIETFQYINARYKNTEIAKEATVWILKSYIMLKRYDDAEALAGLLKNDASFPPRLQGMFSAATAYIYIKQGKNGQALDKIKVALNLARKKSERSRYSYITAQLFERLGQPDSAKYYLGRVLRLNPPYEMAFQAKISLARNYNPADKSQVRAARRYLRSMLRDDKNISYFDQVYYQLGIIEKREGSLNDAVENFEKSLAQPTQNQNQKALSYLALADLYFNQPEYELAQAYYDSTVRVIKPEFEDYDNIVKKQSVLSELIKYKVIEAREDSLQYLARLSPEELDKKIDGWIEAEKNRQKQEEKEKEKKKRLSEIGGNAPGAPTAPASGGGSGSKWYFYNQQQLSMGYNDFVKRWGNRKLSDNWRWSQKEKILVTDPTQLPGNQPPDPNKAIDPNQPEITPEPTTQDPVLSNVPEEKRKYYRDIPYSPVDKKNSNDKLANALFNIGVIYYEKLNDAEQAIISFRSLLVRFPGNEYEPQTYYYLYKIYKTIDSVKSAEYKDLLISKYPNSDYALIINNNPITRETPTGIDPRKTKFYNETFTLFNNGGYTEVKNRKPTADTLLVGTNLYPKYSLLYAMSIGKTEPLENYRKTLGDIIEQYPATDISRRATELLEASKINDKKDTAAAKDTREDVFVYKPELAHFTLVAIPSDKGDINAIKIKISDFNKSTYPNQTFEVTSNVLNATQQLIVIRTFEGRDKAMDYTKQLENFHALLLSGLTREETTYMVITPANYGELVKMKDLAPYTRFYDRNYRR